LKSIGGAQDDDKSASHSFIKVADRGAQARSTKDTSSTPLLPFAEFGERVADVGSGFIGTMGLLGDILLCRPKLLLLSLASAIQKPSFSLLLSS
jgi:hypothetical protein